MSILTDAGGGSTPVGEPAFTRRTWSRSFRQFLRQWNEALPRMPRAKVVTLRSIEDYPDTYDLSAHRIPAALRAELSHWADQFVRMPTPRRVVLLTDLMDETTGEGIHQLFAALRRQVAQIHHDEAAALHAPTPHPTRGDFPLHADLWKAQLLLNVFDRVSAGGDSVFLPVKRLLEFARKSSRVPPEVAREIAELFRHHRDGSYARLFDLLYSDSPWNRDMLRFMRRERYRVRLDSGQGYLLDDRTWLHGREAIDGAMSARRLHRLVFDNLAIARRREHREGAR